MGKHYTGQEAGNIGGHLGETVNLNLDFYDRTCDRLKTLQYQYNYMLIVLLKILGNTEGDHGFWM